jgi:hypothetical protein
MSVHGDARTVTRRETRGSLLLWIGVLTAPLAWAIHLVLNYSLEEWFACSPATQTPGEILGFGVHNVSIAVNATLAAATLVAGFVALSCRLRLRNAEGEGAARARWMALVGIINSCLFGLIIVVGFAPSVVLDVCEFSP